MARQNTSKLKTVIFVQMALSLFVFNSNAHAADVTAQSCSAADIQAAIDAIGTDGGTITIPACSAGANGSLWADDDYVCKHFRGNDVRIVGAGQDATVLQYADGAGPSSSGSCGGDYYRGGAMFQVSGSAFKELGHLTLSGSAADNGGNPLYVGGNACSPAGPMNNARIHHVSIKKFSGSAIYICSNLSGVILFDHMFVGDKADSYAYGFRIHGSADPATWDIPAQYGTNTGIFIEDSVFDGTYHPIAGHGSAKYTVRHNTFSNYSSAMEGHGPTYSFGCMPNGSGDPACNYNYPECYQGVQRVEVYNNTFNDANYANYVRSGGWIITANTYINQTAYNGMIRIEMENSSNGPNCTVANGCPWEYDLDITQNCSSVVTNCFQSPRDVYIWGNTFINPTDPDCVTGDDAKCVQIADKGSGCLREGIEFFGRAPQSGDPRITSYKKFTYPHPLASTGTPTGDGSPGDSADGGQSDTADANCNCHTTRGTSPASFVLLLVALLF